MLDKVQHGVRNAHVLDLMYDLSPDEDLADIDGHLLVLVLDESHVSHEFGSLFTRRIRGLDDSSEFVASVVRAADFPGIPTPSGAPALLHYLCGVCRHRSEGVDDCEDFLEEFIDNNRCRRKR